MYFLLEKYLNDDERKYKYIRSYKKKRICLLDAWELTIRSLKTYDESDIIYLFKSTNLDINIVIERSYVHYDNYLLSYVLMIINNKMKQIFKGCDYKYYSIYKYDTKLF